MKKCLIAFLLLLSCADMASAQEYTDEDVYKTTFSAVKEHYIKKTDVETLAVNALKALNKVDKKVLVGDDDKRVTLYYGGRVLRSKLKPQDKEDIAAWAKLNADMIKELKKVSASARDRDFEILDTTMEETIAKSLDGVSKYYPEGQSEEVGRADNPRNFVASLQDNILYIKIVAFNQFTFDELKKALQQYPNFEGVILDLRASPGGDLAEALKVADAFLAGGILASEVKKDNKRDFFYADEIDLTQDKPMVVLVDGQTTSAAEIVASALQAQSRGKLIGTKTFGKGSKQELFELPNGAVLGLTTGYFYTSAENALDKQGVMPDICVSGMKEEADVEKIVYGEHKAKCMPESRERENLEQKVAKYLIKSQI